MLACRFSNYNVNNTTYIKVRSYLGGASAEIHY
jgi:hypothetical protein